MKSKTYTRLNFHKYTFCIWKEVLPETIKDLRINYISQSGSQYIFTTDGLYRVSNHWGRVADCHWRLVPLAEFKNQNVTVAYANWADFYSNDDSSKLFFIKMDFDTDEVNFYHKLSLEDSDGVVLRNAKETARVIRTIKQVLNETDWARHLNYDDLDILRKEIITELIDTEKTFLEIKKHHL